MIYREVAPPPLLQPFVQTFWTLTGHHAECPDYELILPDGHAELVVHRGDPFRQRLASGQTRIQPAALIAGQMESGVAVAPGHNVDTIGVRFTSCGLAPLCTVPQHALADSLTAAEHVASPGLRRLVAQVGSASSATAALQLLQSGLARLFAAVAPADPRVVAAAALIAHSGGVLGMDRLHAALETSPRWLERRFQMLVGVSPKRLARIVRFQRALGALVGDPGRACADVAVDHGYYDQAHFTAEFHAFTGHAPREFVRERLDALTRAFTSAQPTAQ